MHEPRTWRELLGQLIDNPAERQRTANELKVTPVTLVRWAKGESNPRPHYLQRLLDTFPEQRERLLTLIQKEFRDFSSAGADDAMANEASTIPAEFYARIMHTLATLPQALRLRTLCDLIVEQALKQLDPHRLGMAILVVRCMPPSPGSKVRSLREVMGRGTPPWESSLEQDLILLGAESLAGYVVSWGRLMVNQNLRKKGSTAPGYRGIWEESAAAAPIIRAGAIAGCLLVSSTQPDYFSPARCNLVEGYAELLALAFEREEFYEAEHIGLGAVAPYEVQRSHLSGFRQRVVEIMTRALTERQAITSTQAEELAWQQLAEELLQLSSHMIP